MQGSAWEIAVPTRLGVSALLHGTGILGVGAIAVGAIALGVLPGLLERRWRRRKLGSRKSLSVDEVRQTYFAELAGVTTAQFESTWNEIGRLLRVDPGLLRPDDKLVDLAGPTRGVSLGTDVDRLDEWFQDRLADSGRAQQRPVESIRELILAVVESSSTP